MSKGLKKNEDDVTHLREPVAMATKMEGTTADSMEKEIADAKCECQNLMAACVEKIWLHLPL